MKKKDVKKLLKEHPDFANWLKKDPTKVASLRNNPKEATKLLSKWRAESDKRNILIDFESLSEKSKRASQMLGSIQNVMDLLAEYSKKENNRF